MQSGSEQGKYSFINDKSGLYVTEVYTTYETNIKITIMRLLWHIGKAIGVSVLSKYSLHI